MDVTSTCLAYTSASDIKNKYEQFQEMIAYLQYSHTTHIPADYLIH